MATRGSGAGRGGAALQTYFRGRVLDLEGVCYEKELTYWEVGPADRGGKPRK